MRAKDQISRKYCAPVMFDPFVCAFLIFCTREFPAESETGEPEKIIVERTSYDIVMMVDTFFKMYDSDCRSLLYFMDYQPGMV